MKTTRSVVPSITPLFTTPLLRPAPASPSTPPKYETPLRQELRKFEDLKAVLYSSPYEKGYLRPTDNGWKFSPNMKVKDKLPLGDGGYSKAPFNPAEENLVKPGEKILRSTLQSRLQKKIDLSERILKNPPRAATTPPIAEPNSSLAKANLVTPAITPSTLPSTSTPGTPIAQPIPKAHSDLAKLHDKAHTTERQLSNTAEKFVGPKVNELKQFWEARSSTAQ